MAKAKLFDWNNYLSVERQAKYREAQAEKGLVRMSLWVSETNRKRVLDFAESLKKPQEKSA